MKTQNNSSSVLWAIVLIALGSVFFMKNFQIIDFEIPQNWLSWKLVFVIIALSNFFKGKIVGGVIWTIVSIFIFYPALLHYVSIQSVFQLWPIFLIAIGLNMIIGRQKAVCNS